jgi:hypothetical protein
MLFFIDESWQSTCDGKYKVGVLSAIQIKSHDFNECSMQIYNLKLKHLGFKAASEFEIKGKDVFKNYVFKLESKGIPSNILNLAREILGYMKTSGVSFFASVVFSKEELDLACADVDLLERPFFFLFERIDLFMKENHPGLMAKIIFDDRGYQTNTKISKSVSNFFHKSRAGQSFDTIIKVPFFAISSENAGIQIADLAAYILGARFTGDREKREFFAKIKELEFNSRTLVEVNGRNVPVRGFKVIKEKEAGDLFSPGRTK